LRGLPVVVGGDGDPTKRGVVSTASYEARAFGVQSGTPLRTAARRCPDAVFLPVDRAYYEDISEEVMAALRESDAVVEPLGWDEAFLAAETDDPQPLAEWIHDRVLARTGLHCSVGIGENRLQAKLATGFGKPAGIGRLTSQDWDERLGDEPTQALWGVGARTAARLRSLGIETVRQLAAADRNTLSREFGPTTGPWLILTGRGVGSAEVTAEPWIPRGRSKEVTYQQNLTDWADVEREVARIAREAAQEGDDRAVWRVTVKVRYAPFFTTTHGHKLAAPTRDLDVVEQAALALLRLFEDRRPVRLLGVRTEFVKPDG
jgi:nucleotidyltransferase/DNA polymerase involved in DNA repair